MRSTLREHDTIRPIIWRDQKLHLLDQRKLPEFETWLQIDNPGDTAAAIADLVVRGAPAIGITAAFGAVLSAADHYRQRPEAWREGFAQDLEILRAARPTAINLSWSVNRMASLADEIESDPVPQLLAEAQRIMSDDIEGNHRMGALGAGLLPNGAGVLTHCNTGSLATGGFGTALGVIRSGVSNGKVTRVFAGETRPWLQGARLTAWELQKDGIAVELIADSAAAHLMSLGHVDAVIVGADRVAANGDVANKIGTFALAVAAGHHGIPFIVAAPTSTIDLDTLGGDAIPIEQRPMDEVLNLGNARIAAQGAQAFNPVFDRTPAGLVSYLVTEFGVIEAPNQARIAEHMRVHL